MSHRIKCIARIRPLAANEENEETCLSIDGSTISISDGVTHAKPRIFRVNACLDDASQEEVFEHVIPYLESTLEAGTNNSIFCYGQTGTGKTLTALGFDVWALAALTSGSSKERITSATTYSFNKRGY